MEGDPNPRTTQVQTELVRTGQVKLRVSGGRVKELSVDGQPLRGVTAGELYFETNQPAELKLTFGAFDVEVDS